MPDYIVDVRHVTKRYGNIVALRDITLQLGAGLHLLRGANGSGKSTLLKLLAGVEPCEEGDIVINGHDMRSDLQRAKSQLGWLPSDPDVYGFLRGDALLRMVAAARGVHGATHEAHIRDLLTQLGISTLIDRRFDAMSLGMQRKFMLVAAMMGKPALLLLDEPANALDADALVALNARLIDCAHESCVLIACHDHTFDTAVYSTNQLQHGTLLIAQL